MKTLTAAEMREVDRLTTERFGISSTQLMENAGAAVAEFVLHEISLRFQSPARQIVVLCGKGNNGGDGLVAARYLRQEVRHTTVVLFGSAAELRGDPAVNFERWRQAGGEILVIEDDAAWKAALERVAAADVILDALLGTGLRGAPTGLIANAIGDLNAFSRNATAPIARLIVAVDIPSGLPSDGQAAEGSVVAAHATVTFTAPKIGQLISQGAARCGRLVVRAIGSPAVLVEELGKSAIRWAGPDEFADLPLIRHADSTKGLYGNVLVLAGDQGKKRRGGRAGERAREAGMGGRTTQTARNTQPLAPTRPPPTIH